jgi:iron-sulfur cluster assembly accessory protein
MINKIKTFFMAFEQNLCYTESRNKSKIRNVTMAIADQTRVIEEIPVVTVSAVAASKIRDLMQERELVDHALRVFVAGGGCSGMSYGMAFESNIQDYDTVVDVEAGVRVVIDATSMMYLQGANIDFVDSLMGGGFRIDNPNAASTCGCGHSFRTGEGGDAEASSCGTCSH